ncbi:hypothetical protein ACWDUM_02670 [Rhodococcus sp. NPDC003322]
MSAAYTLEQACLDHPALDALYRDDHTAMRGPGNSMVDQTGAARNPQMLDLDKDGSLLVRPQRRSSPAALGHPEISAGLLRAGKIRLDWDVAGLASVDRIYSNVGRRVLPFRRGGYTADELRAEELKRLGITRRQQAQLDAEYERMLDLAAYGGQPTGAVVFHFAELTDEEGALTVPVVAGMSARRIVRLAGQSSRVCFWCGDRSPAPLDDYLMVDTGFLRVFPTCSGCRDRFDRATDYRGLDWNILSDDWFRVAGGPDDRYI